jgi:AAA family ATP:ADP antiporter
VIIATYTRYTANISIVRLIVWTNAVILSNIVFFWLVLTYFNSAWSHYAFYIWSAMATVIAVAQAWTLANNIFTEEEAKRSFGLIAAGGTVGGVAASFGAKWSIQLSGDSNHLLGLIASGYIIASVLVIWAESRLKGKSFEAESCNAGPPEIYSAKGVSELLSGSVYLKTIAVIILVSVIVSTIIDFHFKIGAKQAYPSTRELADFFSSYYGWLNVATLSVQVLLTGRILSKLGLASSLYVTPGALLTGSVAIIVWPGLHRGRNPKEQHSSKRDGSYLYGRTDERRESDQDISGRGRRKSRRCHRRIHYSTVQPRRSGEIHLLPSFHLYGTDLWLAYP